MNLTYDSAVSIPSLISTHSKQRKRVGQEDLLKTLPLKQNLPIRRTAVTPGVINSNRLLIRKIQSRIDEFETSLGNEHKEAGQLDFGTYKKAVDKLNLRKTLVKESDINSFYKEHEGNYKAIITRLKTPD